MYYATVLLVLVLPFFALASPLPWDGAPGYSGAANNVDGGDVTGGGGVQLIKLFSHNAGVAGTSQSGDSQGGQGGNRFVNGIPAGLGSRGHGKPSNAAATAGGSAGGAGYTGSSGTAKGGNAHTDPELTLLSLGSDNGADGGWSGTGNALGGGAGNVL